MLEHDIKSFRVDQGTTHIQPSTLWQTGSVYAMGLAVLHREESHALTTGMLNIAPIGFTDPNPVEVQQVNTTPHVLGGGISEIRTDNSPLWERCDKS